MYHLVELSESDGIKVFRSLEQHLFLPQAVRRLREIQEMNPNLKFQLIAVLA